MKKLIAISASMMLVAALAGCSNGTNSQSASDGSAGSSQTSQKDEWTNYVTSTTSEFSVSKTAECSYSKGSLEVLVKFKNISDRPIAAIDAVGAVNDVFGTKKMGVNLSVSKKIAVGASANAGSWGSSCYSINEYNADEASLLETDPSNIKLVVSVSKIAFVDGEIIEF
jgi:ABC-type glycerol-3-phosphate transport system substrate-binding protein